MSEKYVKKDCSACEGMGYIEQHADDSDANIGNSIIGFDDCRMCGGTGEIKVQYEVEYNPEDEC